MFAKKIVTTLKTERKCDLNVRRLIKESAYEKKRTRDK